MTESIVQGATPNLSTRIRVLVIEDHSMVAEALQFSLGSDDRLRIVGIASTIAAGVEMAARHTPDVVLMDHGLPDGDGIEGTRQVMDVCPTAHVVMFTADDSDELVRRSIEAGCAGFVHKTKSLKDIVMSVVAAANGEALYPPDVLLRVLSRSRRTASAPNELSPRELEVLQLVAQGWSTDRISETLFLSRHTVRNHVRSVIAKLGAHSKLEAVSVALRAEIISLHPNESSLRSD